MVIWQYMVHRWVVAGPLDAGIVLVTNFEETVVKSSLVQQFVVGA